MNQYDGIIIGSGQGGKPLALDLAAAGWKTALVESTHVGGTCLNVGCTPTKTMIASARAAYTARRSSDYGVETGDIKIDMIKIRQRKRDIVESWRNGSQKRLEEAENLDLIFGQASFTEPETVQVQLNEGGVRQLRAKKIFINTGARPIIPSIDGLNNVPFLDSTSIMELGTIPEHLVVLGGGYIGLEFGQMFRRFGSQVTIIQRSGRLLTREDTDVAEEVAKILSGEGIEILLNTTPEHFKAAGNKKIHITVESPDGEKEVTCSHLLIATGRKPNSDSLNLGSAGIESDDRGYIKVNNRLETNIDGVYAIGDVKGGPAFTHISYDDYRIIRANLLDGGNAGIDGRLIASTIFIDPQLGRVGLTEGEATEGGYEFRVAKLPMSHVARALEIEETNGFMKAIVENKTGQILGCAILGYEGGEVMNMLQIAMMGKLPYTALRDTAFAHPTMGESLNNLFMTLDK